MIEDFPTSIRGNRQTHLIEGGAMALSVLAEGRVELERNAVQRSFHAVIESDSGVTEADWWQVFSKASADVGLRPSVLDCSVDQAARLVDDGADLVLYGGVDPYGWAIVRGRTREPAEILYASNGETVRLKRPKLLRERLSQFAVDGRIRCVAFDRWSLSTSTTLGSEHSDKPLNRLRDLLRPEWGDIWLVILFAFVVGLLALAVPIAVESLVNIVAFGRYLQPVMVLAILLFCFLAFSAAITALQTYVVEIIQQRLFARVAADLANRLPRVSTEATEGKYLPELVNRFLDVVTVQKVTAKMLVDGVSLILVVVIGMVVLGFYHPFLLGFDLVLLASMAFLVLVLGRGAIGTAVKESKVKYYMTAWLEEVVRCPTTFRSAAGKNLSASRSDRLIQDYLTARRKHFRILLRQILFSLGLYALASTVLLGLGGWLVVAGELTLGQLVAAELIVAVIVGSFAKIGKYLESWYDLLAAVDKLGALFDLPAERQGGVLSSATQEAIQIEVNQARYNRGGRVSLPPVSVAVPAGGSLAVLGDSGSGKSTFLDLLYGVRRPTAGQVKVNGIQPSDMQTDDYRSRVELVRPDEVFASTLSENVHLQRPAVTGADVQRALAAVGLASTVMSLPAGIETKLSSDGSPLTDGQIRRLLLARAIASEPSLLLVDGLLDGLSDRECEVALDALLDPDRPWTLIVATGRRSIAERCENVVALSGADTLSAGR